MNATMTQTQTLSPVYTVPAGHPDSCLCPPCMLADMDRVMIENGIDPANYSDNRNGETVESERTRYATPGTRCGNGYVRLVSDKQVRFIKSLMASRDISGLRFLPGSENIERMSLAGARDLISKLMECPEKKGVAAPVAEKASEKQVAFLTNLLAERTFPDADSIDPSTIGKRDASQLINRLMSAPKKPVVTAPASVSAPESTVSLEGMHMYQERIFKVQKAVHGSGNLYAKELVNGSFVYAPGAIRSLSADTKMTLEQAKEYGVLYGVCCVCAKTLTDEKSIEAGVGPVCAKKF